VPLSFLSFLATMESEVVWKLL